MKISKRLQAIADLIPSQHYQHIWDCCCDHGHLGMTLLSQDCAKHIHFVDIVPAIMTQLEQKLARYFSSQQWQVHCCDVNDLALAPNSRQLVIIAGVGGEQTAKMVSQLVNKFPDLTLDFILCPVRQQYHVRRSLIELDYHLIDEVLIEENNRFYEIIYLSYQGANLLTDVGSLLWRKQDLQALNYLTRTIAHYQREANFKNDDASPQALFAYQQLRLAVAI